MYYVYRNHLSEGFYASTEELSYSELYCEQCGDSDNLVGTADNEQDLAELMEHLVRERDMEYEWEDDEDG